MRGLESNRGAWVPTRCTCSPARAAEQHVAVLRRKGGSVDREALFTSLYADWRSLSGSPTTLPHGPALYHPCTLCQQAGSPRLKSAIGLLVATIGCTTKVPRAASHPPTYYPHFAHTAGPPSAQHTAT